ncbi:MAG: hypothetical protein OHK0047_12810 [Leptolyngbyaceae cyanobacterium]
MLEKFGNWMFFQAPTPNPRPLPLSQTWATVYRHLGKTQSLDPGDFPPVPRCVGSDLPHTPRKG